MEYEYTEENPEVAEDADVSEEGEESETPEGEEGEGEKEGEGSEGDEEGADDAEEKGKPEHKKTAQDRIQQLANEKRELAERLERLESQFAKQQEEKPDYVEVDIERVNAHIQATSDQIEELKLEGNYVAAKKLELGLQKLINDLEENDKKRDAYLNRQKESKSKVDAGQERLKRLDDAADFYRQNAKIEPAVWDKMGAWFAEACQKDPILGREFAERVEKGEIGAIKWAHDYTLKNMGVKERASIDSKNTNKQKAAAASPTPGGKPSPVDLSKALEKAKETNTPEAWVEYQAIKRKAQGR